MKLKKFFAVSFVLAASVFLFSCNEKNETDNNGNNNIKETVGEIREPVVSEGIGGYDEELLDLKNYNLQYVQDTDAQPCFEWTRMAKSKNGYYYWGEFPIEKGEGLLMFFDRATEKTVPVCNKPECSHMDESCNAWFDAKSSVENGDIEYDRSIMMFYEGHVYVIGYDFEGNMYLYKVSEDGSTCEQYMKLYKNEPTEPGNPNSINCATPEICIHRGYVYYLEAFESEPRIRRMKMGGDTEEVVFKLTGERPNVYRIKPYGDYVFFQAGNFIDDTYIDIEAGVFAYNINTGEIKLVRKGVYSDYVIADNKLYYYHDKGTNVYDMVTGKEERLEGVNSENDQIYVDSQYVYVMESETVKIYDLRGNLVYSGGINVISGMCDGEYIFVSTVIAGVMEYGGFAALDISDAVSGDGKWQYLR